MKTTLFKSFMLGTLIVIGTLFILGSGNGLGEDGSGEMKVTKTGQTTIYAEFDDGYYQMGLERNFTRNDSENIVTDHTRGLMWQDDEETERPISGNYEINEKIEKLCMKVHLGGYDDWRVPTKDELLSIAYFGPGYSTLDPIFRHISATGDYWCQSESNMDGWYGRTMHIFFGKGVIDSTYIYAFPLSLRCVRGEKTAMERFERDPEKKVVLDKNSSLMWPDSPDSSEWQKNWYDALRHCEELVYADYSDWRLPNIAELFSRHDTRRGENGAINEAFRFSSAGAWSSTTPQVYSSRAYIVETMQNGSMIYRLEKSKKLHFTCVRGGVSIEKNNPPVAENQTVQVPKNSVQKITLTGSDADGDPLTFIITTDPRHGLVAGTPPDINYTPDFDYTGSDSFTFKVNDGKVDSPDANVTLTIYEPATGKLLKTGQTTSYVDYDDGYYRKGAPRDFIRDDVLNIVEDRTNNLMWQDDGDAKTYTADKDEADAYCAASTLGGFTDWRVPSVEELMTLTNKGHYDSAIEPVFVNTASAFYMTSTRDRTVYDDSADGLHRWLVDFMAGYDAVTSQVGATQHLRCVRGDRLVHHTFTRDDSKNVVIDDTAKLMWQDDKAVKEKPFDWQGAIDYCETLSLGGYDDWRMPNFNELYSIWDRSLPSYDASKSAIDTSFENVSPGAPYWSSTTDKWNNTFAYIILSSTGSTTGEGAKKTNDSDATVRCVRDMP